MAEFNSKQKDVALYPFGLNSCILSTWIKFMRSVHMDRFHALYSNINYRMINVSNSTYLEEETIKNITTSASSKFYV